MLSLRQQFQEAKTSSYFPIPAFRIAVLFVDEKEVREKHKTESWFVIVVHRVLNVNWKEEEKHATTIKELGKPVLVSKWKKELLISVMM